MLIVMEQRRKFGTFYKEQQHLHIDEGLGERVGQLNPELFFLPERNQTVVSQHEPRNDEGPFSLLLVLCKDHIL